ncbi:MAG: inorganic phosphate transporter [Bacteroidales bacterium]
MLFAVFLTSGLFLGWSLGANDAANIFGTAVGSKMLRFRKAAFIASIFVILGAVFQGRGTSETLSSLSSVDALGGAFTVALCAALTVFGMTRNGLPVSTTQAIVGAIIGWSLFTGNKTDLNVLAKIVGSWVSSPVLGAIFGALLFLLLRQVLRRLKLHAIKLDSYIRIGLITAGAFGAFSLGANNIANVMGVFIPSAPDLTLDFGLFTLDGTQLLFLLGGLAIAVGIFTYSHRVMNTVGNGILALTSEAAIVIVLSQALVLFLFSSSSFANLLHSIGLPSLPLVPVSSTQVVIGSLLGIGLVKGVRELNFRMLGGVALGWVLTPLISGLITYFALFFVQNVFKLQVSGLAREAAAPSQLKFPGEAITNIDLVQPAIIAVFVIIIILLAYLLIGQWKQRKKAEDSLHAQHEEIYRFRKTLNELEINTVQKENELLNTKLEIKRKEFIGAAQNIAQQKEFLENLADRIEKIPADKESSEAITASLRDLLSSVRQKMSFTDELTQFYVQIEKVHKDFRMKLETAYPDLTPQEHKLAMLLRLNFSTKEIASLMNIAPKSVEISRYRLRKKLKLKQGESLTNYINNL